MPAKYLVKGATRDGEFVTQSAMAGLFGDCDIFRPDRTPALVVHRVEGNCLLRTQPVGHDGAAFHGIARAKGGISGQILRIGLDQYAVTTQRVEQLGVVVSRRGERADVSVANARRQSQALKQ